MLTFLLISSRRRSILESHLIVMYRLCEIPKANLIILILVNYLIVITSSWGAEIWQINQLELRVPRGKPLTDEFFRSSLLKDRIFFTDVRLQRKMFSLRVFTRSKPRHLRAFRHFNQARGSYRKAFVRCRAKRNSW